MLGVHSRYGRASAINQPLLMMAVGVNTVFNDGKRLRSAAKAPSTAATTIPAREVTGWADHVDRTPMVSAQPPGIIRMLGLPADTIEVTYFHKSYEENQNCNMAQR